MRILVVSDIHGNLPALEAVIRDASRRGFDQVVNLGDNVSGPLLVCETAQYLMAQTAWTHLAGNHERQVLHPTPNESLSDSYARDQLSAAELAWMTTLRPTRALHDEVLLCHGTPGSDLQELLETEDQLASVADIEARLGDTQASLVLCGHSHVPRSVRVHMSHHEGRGILIVNPGSVGLQAYLQPSPPGFIQTGTPDARYAIVERIQKAWHTQLITVPYDHRPMATLALKHGRPDWHQALLSGTVNPPDSRASS